MCGEAETGTLDDMTGRRLCSKCGRRRSENFFYEGRGQCKDCLNEQKKAAGWFSTPRQSRKRKKVELSLSDDAHEKLERLAATHPKGTKSAAIEDLIMKAKE